MDWTSLQPGDLAADRFDILGEAGRGLHSVVYFAFDMATQARVAVKFAEWDLADDAQSPEPLPQHPNTVEVRQVIQVQPGVVAIALQHVSGPSLWKVMQRGPIDELPAWQLLRDVAAGLAHVHQLGFSHGGVRPASIDLEIQVGGVLARLSGLEVALLRRAGAAPSATFDPASPYAPPGQPAGSDTGPSADIYALGATVWHAVTGSRYHPNSTAPPLSEPLRDLLLHCLRPQASERYADGEALLRALSEARGADLDGLNTLAPLVLDATSVAPPAAALDPRLPLDAPPVPRSLETVEVFEDPAPEGLPPPPKRPRTSRRWLVLLLVWPIALLLALLGAFLASYFVGGSMASSRSDGGLTLTDEVPLPVPAAAPEATDAHRAAADEAVSALRPVDPTPQPQRAAPPVAPRPTAAAPAPRPTRTAESQPASQAVEHSSPEAHVPAEPPMGDVPKPTGVAPSPVPPAPVAAMAPVPAVPVTESELPSALIGRHTWAGEVGGRPSTWEIDVAEGGVATGMIRVRIGAETISHTVSGKAVVRDGTLLVDLAADDRARTAHYSGTFSNEAGLGTVVVNGRDRTSWTLRRL